MTPGEQVYDSEDVDLDGCNDIYEKQLIVLYDFTRYLAYNHKVL